MNNKQLYLGSRAAAGRRKESQRRTSGSLWRRPSAQSYRTRTELNIIFKGVMITDDFQVFNKVREIHSTAIQLVLKMISNTIEVSKCHSM